MVVELGSKNGATQHQIGFRRRDGSSRDLQLLEKAGQSFRRLLPASNKLVSRVTYGPYLEHADFSSMPRVLALTWPGMYHVRIFRAKRVSNSHLGYTAI